MSAISVQPLVSVTQVQLLVGPLEAVARDLRMEGDLVVVVLEGLLPLLEEHHSGRELDPVEHLPVGGIGSHS